MDTVYATLWPKTPYLVLMASSEFKMAKTTFLSTCLIFAAVQSLWNHHQRPTKNLTKWWKSRNSQGLIKYDRYWHKFGQFWPVISDFFGQYLNFSPFFNKSPQFRVFFKRNSQYFGRNSSTMYTWRLQKNILYFVTFLASKIEITTSKSNTEKKEFFLLKLYAKHLQLWNNQKFTKMSPFWGTVEGGLGEEGRVDFPYVSKIRLY